MPLQRALHESFVQHVARFALTFIAVSLTFLPSALAYTVKKTASGAPIHWQHEALVVEIGPRLREAMPDLEAEQSVLMGSDAWRGLGGPDLILGGRAADFAAESRVQVEIADDWTYGPELLAVTVTTYLPGSGRLLSAEIWLNPSHRFAILEREGSDGYDLPSVLAHEFGHVLGLDESAVAGSTMWPRIRAGEVHQRQLSIDDEEGIFELYPEGTFDSETASTCAHAQVARTNPSQQATWVALLVGALLVLRERRRRR